MIEELKEHKYFRYSGKYFYGEYNEKDFFNGLFILDHIDEKNNIIYAKEFNAFDDIYEQFPVEILLDPTFKIIEDKEYNKQVKIRNRDIKKQTKIEFKKLKRKHKLLEKEKNKHFKEIKPKIKRNTKVLLVGKYNRSYVDFTKKGDVLYVDDVKLIDNKIYYFLRVVAPRKNRGIYVFFTEKGFEEQFLKIDENDSNDLNYNYIYKNTTCYIGKVKK